jgi:hypothetical protein
MESLYAVTIVRDVSVQTYPFTDYFQGFEKAEAVQRLFGDATSSVLHNLQIEFYNGRSGMSFSDLDGHIRVNVTYLNQGDAMDLYLDTLHQLVHLKQFREGKPIYSNLIRVNQPLELEACRFTVAEAKRLGLSEAQIYAYLRTEWMSEDDLRTLAEALHVQLNTLTSSTRASPVKATFVREAQVTLYPFMDYFQGFENVEAIQQLFGEQTEDVLRHLKVGFSGRRGYMGVSDRDGHLTVSADYLKHGNIYDIYLDIIHELTHVKQFLEGRELFDNHYRYVERPTEIEAFRNAIAEARRLGFSDARLRRYLRTEWMTNDDFQRLAHTLHVPTR